MLEQAHPELEVEAQTHRPEAQRRFKALQRQLAPNSPTHEARKGEMRQLTCNVYSAMECTWSISAMHFWPWPMPEDGNTPTTITCAKDAWSGIIMAGEFRAWYCMDLQPTHIANRSAVCTKRETTSWNCSTLRSNNTCFCKLTYIILNKTTHWYNAILEIKIKLFYFVLFSF